MRRARPDVCETASSGHLSTPKKRCSPKIPSVPTIPTSTALPFVRMTTEIAPERGK